MSKPLINFDDLIKKFETEANNLITYHCKCDCGRRFLCDNECEYVGEQDGSENDPFLCLCKYCYAEAYAKNPKEFHAPFKQCRTKEEKEKVSFT